jgi:DedD protein
MERKKLLLISVSVGIFLVLVLGASILIFTNQASNPVAQNSAPYQPDSSPFQTTVPATPTPDPASATDATATPQVSVLAGTVPQQAPQQTAPQAAVQPGTSPVSTANNIYIGTNPGDSITVEELRDGKTRTVINASRTNTPPVVVIPPAQSNVSTVAASRETQQKQTTAAPKPKATVAAKATPAAASAKPAAPNNVRTDYWVQAGAFTVKSRADETKDSLAKKGIGSIVTSTDLDGKTYYRVRVGPYTTSNEAEYWKGQITSISGLQGAMVWKNAIKL